MDVLLAWELGSGLGHFNRLFQLGDALVGQGQRVAYVLVQQPPLDDGTAAVPREVMQAPFLKKPERLPPFAICNYGELLLHCGYRRPVDLQALFHGWCAIFQRYQPRLLIADHAPTALLAARALDLKAIRFGTGFAAPPSVTPFPLLSPLLEHFSERLRASEQTVLETVNRVLVECKYEPLVNLKDMFDSVERDFITSFPELDQYPARGPADYCGPMYLAEGGVEPAWPGDHQPRVFAYLKPEYPNFRATVAQLADSGANVLIYARNLDRAITDHYASPRVAFAAQPVNPQYAAAGADLTVCHASHTTVLQSLLAGKPLVLLPMYREQEMTAERVLALGAGVVAAVDSALSEEAIAAAARFAERHRAYSGALELQHLLAVCKALTVPGI